MTHPAIGIDLGTTYCAVATIDKFGKPRMLLNREGFTLTPSVVQVGIDGRVIAGEPAKNSAAFEPERTVQFFKIHMGDDNWAAPIGAQHYTAAQLSAYLLKRLKEDAEKELKQEITKAVITVPAYFGDGARVATKQAAEIAGLEVLQLVNEPTAAAVDYGSESASGDAPRTVFVLDLGGGTLDATILRIEASSSRQQELRVLRTDGNHDLGGIHWDDVIVDMVRSRFRDEHQMTLDNEGEADAQQRAETAKRTLSDKDYAIVQVSAGKRVSFKLARGEFEGASRHLVSRCRDLLMHILLEEYPAPTDFRTKIDQVLLVGGSTRMPMIQALAKEICEKDPVASNREDESVARGAALIVYQCLKEKGLPPASGQIEKPMSLAVFDVVSHSLGLIVLDKSKNIHYNDFLIDRFKPPSSGCGQSVRNKRRQPNWRTCSGHGRRKHPS